MPGKTNLAADAASRYPASEMISHDGDLTDESLLIVLRSMPFNRNHLGRNCRKKR